MIVAGQFYEVQSSKMCVMAFNEVAVMSLPLEKMQSAEVRERKWSALSKRDLNGDQADGRGRSRTLNARGIQLDDLSEIQVLGEGVLAV